ncbi:triacylglycerol lipase [Ancylostoma duodenale]|uniref:Triacylglycerol lipase n=1 Tax=Ancylostoma duodenale TaxID=51022 RepID=A0A0C2GXG9_9BILA|nr:triacylglycerol lipase [Ancylostoma duodenale]
MVAVIIALLFALSSADEDTSEEERLDFIEYSDHFARKIILTISAAAYSDNPQECLSHRLGKVTDTYQYSFPCQDGVCSGFVALLHKYNAIAVGFRGTQKPGQLIQQGIDALLSPWSEWKHGGRVSGYVKFTYIRLWANLEDKFKKFMAEHPDWDIWVGGHSLGGALATLAASDIVESRIAVNPDKVKLVTLGQPRVGDRKFADALNEQVEYSYRVVHWMDVVPSIPKTGYWHQGEENWKKTKMDEYEREPTVKRKRFLASISGQHGEDSVYCSAKYLPTSISDHKTYFGKVVSDYGKGGCKT